MSVKHNMQDLENEIASVETDAISEEQINADQNYNSLDNEHKYIVSKIPYPDVQPYDTGVDYDDISDIQYKKRENAPWWEKEIAIKKYCDDGSLYSGHLYVDNTHYYIMDGRQLGTKTLEISGERVCLINSDDRQCSDYIRWWRYPSVNKRVQLSRNITMKARKVKDVDIILDKGSELFSEISDA